MNTPLQNLKHYFRNNETITKEELNTAIEELYDNERAAIMNAAEKFANTLGIEDEDILEYYNSLYKTNKPMKELFKLTIEFTRIFIGFILAIMILGTFDLYYELKRLYERSRKRTTCENDIPRHKTRNHI